MPEVDAHGVEIDVVDIGARRRDEVAHQLIAGLRIRAQHHRRLLHHRVGAQRCLDLTQFDALTTQLDLEVDAAEVLELAFDRPPHEVARAIEARSRYAERVGHESVRSKVRPAVIAARQLHAGEVQFARRPHRDRGESRIQHVDLDIPERTPMGTVVASSPVHRHPVARTVASVGP